MDLFEETGAYLRGHFLLTSGLHSGEYLQCAKVLAYPDYAERLGRDLAVRLRELASGPVDVVHAPAQGGWRGRWECHFFSRRETAPPGTWRCGGDLRYSRGKRR